MKVSGKATLTVSISDYQAIYSVKGHPIVHDEVVLKLSFHLYPRKIKIYFEVLCLWTVITCLSIHIIFKNLLCFYSCCVCLGCHSAVYRCEGQRTVWECRFSSSIMWVPAASIRVSGLAPVVFIRRPVFWHSIYITFTGG